MKQLKQLLLFLSCFHIMGAYAQDNVIKIDTLFKNEIEKKLSIDTSCKILLKNIIVTGNKKTKDYWHQIVSHKFGQMLKPNIRGNQEK